MLMKKGMSFLQKLLLNQHLFHLKQIESKLIMDLDNKGKVTGAELKSGIKGQTYMDEQGDIADDQGHKIINLKQQSN